MKYAIKSKMFESEVFIVDLIIEVVFQSFYCFGLLEVLKPFMTALFSASMWGISSAFLYSARGP